MAVSNFIRLIWSIFPGNILNPLSGTLPHGKTMIAMKFMYQLFPKYEFCRRGFYFEDDSDLSTYSITCNNNGTYTNVPMKRCIDPEGRGSVDRTSTLKIPSLY